MAKATTYVSFLAAILCAVFFGAWLQTRDLTWIGVMGAYIPFLMILATAGAAASLIRSRKVIPAYFAAWVVIVICIIGYGRYSQVWIVIFENHADIPITEVKMLGPAAPQEAYGGVAVGEKRELELVPKNEGPVVVLFETTEGTLRTHSGVSWTAFSGTKTELIVERDAAHKLVLRDIPAGPGPIAKVFAWPLELFSRR